MGAMLKRGSVREREEWRKREGKGREEREEREGGGWKIINYSSVVFE